ncbi:MAG: hypothetical protein B6240_00520 [Desulfobacteraceae bacterium 4572_87]|nr:MAG: hypothetical protein B6240_00520 [Desulfobacteraceae bacterium 4572_87]
MSPTIPEKALYLEKLKEGRYNVPEFIYVPAEDFENENFETLEAFLNRHQESFKVIARSAHPLEESFKSGTFDSLETYADIAGIQYARNRMTRLGEKVSRLSILRQQKFHHAPELDLADMGVIVMPFINGNGVMAKMIGKTWEFGYCRNRAHKVESEPFITKTPHDTGLLEISQSIQEYLGFKCEIEYIISGDGEIHVVQAKDISQIETLDEKESERSVNLDGVRRIRKRRNYRERPIFVMDNTTFYMNIIDQCENITIGDENTEPHIQDAMDIIAAQEAEFENFALRHERFAILGLAIEAPGDLYQIANHYLDEMPDFQAPLSKALYNNLYKRDYFLSEADTLIARDDIRINLCSHDAYGIATVRNPVWSVYWHMNRDESVVRRFRKLGFKTGDFIGIDIDMDEKPTAYRL